MNTVTTVTLSPVQRDTRPEARLAQPVTPSESDSTGTGSRRGSAPGAGGGRGPPATDFPLSPVQPAGAPGLARQPGHPLATFSGPSYLQCMSVCQVITKEVKNLTAGLE